MDSKTFAAMKAKGAKTTKEQLSGIQELAKKKREAKVKPEEKGTKTTKACIK